MTKRTRWVVASVVALALSVSIVGCGGRTDGGSPIPAPSETSTTVVTAPTGEP
ncbi:MAG: hypothetical protein KDA95_09675 [Acidimicrobiales bacterium]|nr:hypothetical protein [Acidimicrobiales bacterium]